jgi:predicted transcriptional regulator of viral defense system
MAIQPTNRDLTFKTFKGRSMMRLADLRAAGVTSVTLRRMQDAGEIVKLGRGVYQIADADYTAEHSLAEAALRVPNGVVCLVSALAHHGLTDQMPSKVWMAIGHKAWAPATSSPPLRIVRFADNFLADAVDIIVIEDVSVRIFGVAKTVADSFRHRRSVGLAVALEGLQEALRQRKATASEILIAAERGRVGTIVRPYLTALTANG